MNTIQNKFSNLQIAKKEDIEHIKYFVKFYDSKLWCDRLIDGELFMQAAEHHWHTEQTLKKKYQTDGNDTRVFNCMGVNSNRPIYCMYIVYDTDIVRNHITFSDQLLMDFCGQDNDITKISAIIIQAPQFLEKINDALLKQNLFAYSGVVKYDKCKARDEWLLEHNLYNAVCLFKYPIFQHQKEFRVQMRLKCDLVNCEIKGESFENDSEIPKKYAPYKLQIGSIAGISNQFTYNDLIRSGHNYILAL
ncbi:hypothetical protein [Caproicibacterium sp. BJN0003]|uniref:hypothetical protein n=1 Tax=Caproicibacterium sp. BJN0003 TaxID=2994078 RepID=UPI00225097E0|nr:hypothetical protein [Caproicibacterium sp. BJN0003]UZT82918.1 hypothetical protein OP489_03670 [Caproicibacterium sp. BJN0003]